MTTNEKTTLTLIRHGETDGNIQNIIQGHEDWSLNAKGREQAERLAARSKHWPKPPTAVIASPLKRAKETAEILGAAHGLTPVLDERLMEMGFGEFEGLSRPEADKKHGPDYLDGFFHNRNNPEAPTGGETCLAVLERMIAAAADLRRDYHGQHIAVVSHGLILRNYCHHLLEVPVGRPRFRFRNTAVTQLNFIGDRIMFGAIGDASHLNGPA